MDGLNALVAPVLGAAVVALAILSAFLLVLLVVLFRRTGRLERRLDGLTRGSDGASLEAVLRTHLDRVDTVGREVDEVAARAAMLEQAQRKAIQRIGLVRFNPFEDTGGNQSFALALLDQLGDGFVVSSLHARAGTRVYGKAISKGRSDANLSSEESEALRLALGTGAGAAKAG